MAEGRGDVIRRKLGSVKAEAQQRAAEGRPGPEKAWRMALARAARDHLKLAMDVTRLSMDRVSLAELLELAPERGLISVLEGPGQALGVMLIAPDVMAGLIEAQTTGVVTPAAAPDRRPTRTDAAMTAGLIDGAMAELERGLRDLNGEEWALGYRYSSFLEDIRPLGLLLEDIPFRLLRAEVSLAMGAKSGAIFMALPADLRAVSKEPAHELRAAAEAVLFAQDFTERVLGADCLLDGVLARVSLTLAQVMDFEVGQIVPLGAASVERISLEGMDGRKLWEGRLGQNRGLCAVRLTDQAGGAEAAATPSARRAAPMAEPDPIDMMEMALDPDPMIWATGTD